MVLFFADGFILGSAHLAGVYCPGQEDEGAACNGPALPAAVQGIVKQIRQTIAEMTAIVMRDNCQE